MAGDGHRDERGRWHVRGERRRHGDGNHRAHGPAALRGQERPRHPAPRVARARERRGSRGRHDRPPGRGRDDLRLRLRASSRRREEPGRGDLRDARARHRRRAEGHRLHRVGGGRATRPGRPHALRSARVPAGRRERQLGQPADERGAGHREHPGPHDAPRDAPAHRAELSHAADADDGPGDGVRRRDGDAQRRGHEQGDRAAGLGAEAADGLQLGDLHAHGAHDAPAARQGAARHRHVTGDHDPERDAGAAGPGMDDPVADQRHHDDAHGLLRVVAAVAQRVQARRDQLQAAEVLVDRALRALAEQRHHQRHQREAEDGADERRQDDEQGRLLEEGQVERAEALDHAVGLRAAGDDGRAGDAAEQRVRRRRGQAPPPREQVPHDRAAQARRDERQGDHVRVDALGDVAGDVRAEHQERDEVEERGPEDGDARAEHARGDDRGD